MSIRPPDEKFFDIGPISNSVDTDADSTSKVNSKSWSSINFFQKYQSFAMRTIWIEEFGNHS